MKSFWILTIFLLGVVELNAEVKGFIETKLYDHFRLPENVRPEKYNLRVVTHLESPPNLTFYGDVEMYLEVLANTPNIIVHAQNLTIDHTKIKVRNVDEKMSENCVKSVDHNYNHDYYIMNLCEPVQRGDNLIIMIPFQGILNQKLRGYYRSSYFDKKSGTTRWLSVTQFEPASARAAFPCFDEPDFKASFSVVLGHHEDYNALSNMPLKEMRKMQGKRDWVWSEFEESVPMSTYLVAYTINDFEHVEAKKIERVKFRTWSRRDAISQCKYAGIVGPQVLSFYENVFDIKFPLQKIDQMAVPDFGAGAMENWGLVTYRETALLYADNVSSVASKQRVASVIAHELAHQWFGNLVTMKWWTDLWLNEGFATYVASLGLEHINPEWRSLDEESVENALAIFKLDALKTSHPVSQPIHHVNEISEIFDSISYKKGSTVLRMMHNFLGNEAFYKGIKNYLVKNAYGNAEQDDLWFTLTESAHHYRAIPANLRIKPIMDSWTLQTGYPIIYVERDYQKNTATISQSRYLLDADASRSENDNCWWVPLSFTTERHADFSNTAPNAWLECDENNVPVNLTIEELPLENEWVLFNLQMTGLYKVKYDDENWELLIKTLRNGDLDDIHILNRAQLIDDALTLAWSGDQNYDVAMRLVEYLVRETEYIPWKAALENLANVNRILRQTDQYDHFKRYVRKIVTPIYLHLNGLNESKEMTASHSQILHKALISGWACRFEVDDCVPKARSYFHSWRNVQAPDEENTVPRDLRSVVYCTAMRHGSEEDWHFLWNRYKRSNIAAEKKVMLTALGCTRDITLLQKLLSWAFATDSNIRKQDSAYAFSAVARGEVGYLLAKDYFLSNIAYLHDFYDPDTSELSRLISALSDQMSSTHDHNLLKTFIEQNRKYLSKIEKSVSRALETVHINAQWKHRHFRAVTQQLKERLKFL